MAGKTSSSRRKFLKAVPAAVAGAVTTQALVQGQGQNGGVITAQTVDCAEQISGLEFHSDEEAAIARTLNQHLGTYQQLRDVAIPAETPPALSFHPALPGDEPKGPATPGKTLRYTKPGPRAVTRPANLEEVAFWPVTKLAALIERKLVTSTELTQMYLARLKRHAPALFCVVTLTEELALQQAANADKEIAAGKYRGPLHGIPWGAKDLFATRGIRTTWGAEPYESQVIDHDATIVERLRDAGAVLVAKLSMGALAQGGVWFGGSTRNPWNPQASSSGSSAGPGSATAAGLVGFSIGTETRGSIISPSATNGVVGLRPTYGRVSRYGAMELSWTMDKVGPMCRYVEDCVLVLNAIYGPDGRDQSVANAAFDWNPTAPLSSYRIGYVRSDFEEAAAGAGRAAGAGGGGGRGGGRGGGNPADAAERLKMMRAVLDVYRGLGAKLEPVDLPSSIPVNALGFVLSVESAFAFDELTRSRGIDTMQNSSWPATFRSHRFVPAVEYLRAQRIRTLLMQEWRTFMVRYDAFLSSNSAGLAATNLTGHPAIAVKCGFQNGTPRALMVTGRLYEEEKIARIALAYEQATEWKDRHPSLR
ncbi:MAG TPA: amidase [Vicinamibacterales bacterium]|nr:amidase [Vicinamibacterales bacterium]